MTRSRMDIESDVRRVQTEMELFKGVQEKLFGTIDEHLKITARILEDLKSFKEEWTLHKEIEKIYAQIGELVYYTKARKDKEHTAARKKLFQAYRISKSTQIPSMINNLKEKVARIEAAGLHYPKDYNQHGGVIYRVLCSCGEETQYKYPLKTLDDFECPRKTKK